MLTTKMTLKEMIDFNPSSEDMLSLPLEAVVYVKMFVISPEKEYNYEFFRNHFYKDDINEIINNPLDIQIHDFDSNKENVGDQFISVLDMTSKVIYEELEQYFKDMLLDYNHDAFIMIYMYTHNDKKYLMTDEDGVIKTNELKFNDK